MRCFPFSNSDDSRKTTKSSVSVRSSSASTSTTTTDQFNSQNVSSDVSAAEESPTRISVFPSSSSCRRRGKGLREFTLPELKTATKNFSRSVMLGEGGFGGVYKGSIVLHSQNSNNRIDVAVKQLSTRGLQGHKEWVTEVNVLGVVDHPNLVKLIGYCGEDDERGIQRLLVYEYLANRSVQDHLSSRFLAPLPWSTRLNIAQDAARGLAYLHEGMDFQIIFRDFKSSNILLDQEWNAKLSDFGLARLGPLEGISHVSTAVVGTVGYAAPEYIQTGRLTSKSDVWSYGVFLYELITGRRPMDRNRPKNEQKLLNWVRPHITQDLSKFARILDPRLEGKYSLKSAQKLAAIANRCLLKQPKNRPKMSRVLEMVNQVVEEERPESAPERCSGPEDGKGRIYVKCLKTSFVEHIIRDKKFGWKTLRLRMLKTH